MAQVPLSKLGPNKYVPDSSTANNRTQTLYSASQVVNSHHKSTHNNNNNTDSDSNSDTISTTSVDPDSRSLADYPATYSSQKVHHHKHQQQSKILEICVDCYQIMDGVVVSACLDDLAMTGETDGVASIRNDPHQFRMKSNSRDLIKSAHYNNSMQHAGSNASNNNYASHCVESNCSSQTDLNTMRTSCSNSSSIVMQSLSDVDIVSHQRTESNDSPVFLNTKRRMSHQSTPTQAVAVVNPSETRLDKNELSHIALNPSQLEQINSEYTDLSSSASSKTSSSNEASEQFHSIINDSENNNNNSFNKSLRDGLTLNLRQVYSQNTP
jgi:hypothetical protein